MGYQSRLNSGLAPRNRSWRGELARCGLMMALVATGGVAFVEAAGAEANPAEFQIANASNGGVGSATVAGSTITIKQIVTGDNDGNTIITGDIVGSAEFHGGETASPTDIDISLDVGPQTVDASGGDGGEAVASSPEVPARANETGNIIIENTNINRNDNSSEATAIITVP